MSNALELESVGMVFNPGADGSVTALAEIDLRVAPGEFVSLIGPSGCGKSTMLRIIGDLLQPTSGTLRVNEKSAHQARLDRDYGMVFQQATLLEWRKIAANVELPLEIMDVPGPERAARARQMLELVQLEQFADAFPWQLSGGMQQRVAIAQSLMMTPSILLMDEPFGALDPDTREEMQLFLLELWEEEKMTIFFVTHDLEEALFVGTRILVLSQYYSDDRGDGVLRGSRIVADHHLAEVASSTLVKHDPEFVRLIESLRQDGFDPEHLQHVKSFNLEHTDSFQTLDVGLADD